MNFLVFLLISLYLCASIVDADIYFEKGSPHVKLSQKAGISGSIKFSRDGRPYNSFMGIPFATIQERFAASEVISEPTWENIRDATKAGPPCPQNAFGGVFLEGNEFDCLNLNVYVPMSHKPRDKPYPVMVWVHGGGFVWGSGSGYGASYFMDEDVILVTINYRLGVIGFLSTGDEVVPGNNGLKDQVVGLKWVQENIEKFGGDKSSVTIMGESAGGASTHYLLLSPTTNGLFHRVISQSGSALSLWAYQKDGKLNAENLANFLECPKKSSEISSEEILQCLKSKTVKEINTAQSEFQKKWPPKSEGMTFAPVAEPKATPGSKNIPFLTMPPLTQLKNPMRSIPWMVGVTEDEGFLFAPSKSELLDELNANWDEFAPITLLYGKYFSSQDEVNEVSKKLREFYFGENKVSFDTRKSVVDVYSDSAFNFGVRKSAKKTASKWNDVYLYEYAYSGLLREVKNPGFLAIMSGMNPSGDKHVGHGQDIFVQFDTTGILPETVEKNIIPANSPMEEFSKNFVRLWASFAKYGKPDHVWGKNSNVKWTPITKDQVGKNGNLKYFKLDTIPEFIEEPFTERMEFWDKLWDEHFVPAMLNKKDTSQKTEL